MEDVLQIREALDELAAKIACEQISEEQLEELVATMHEFEESTKTDNVKKIAEADVKFHDIIYQSTGNPKLVNMLNNLREQMYRYRVEYLKDENNYPTLMKEHKDIVEGLVRKNKTQVTETMHQHVKNQAVAVKAMIQEQESEVTARRTGKLHKKWKTVQTRKRISILLILFRIRGN